MTNNISFHNVFLFLIEVRIVKSELIIYRIHFRREFGKEEGPTISDFAATFSGLARTFSSFESTAFFSFMAIFAGFLATFSLWID